MTPDSSRDRTERRNLISTTEPEAPQPSDGISEADMIIKLTAALRPLVTVASERASFLADIAEKTMDTGGAAHIAAEAEHWRELAERGKQALFEAGGAAIFAS